METQRDGGEKLTKIEGWGQRGARCKGKAQGKMAGEGWRVREQEKSGRERWKGTRGEEQNRETGGGRTGERQRDVERETDKER